MILLFPFMERAHFHGDPIVKTIFLRRKNNFLSTTEYHIGTRGKIHKNENENMKAQETKHNGGKKLHKIHKKRGGRKKTKRHKNTVKAERTRN